MWRTRSLINCQEPLGYRAVAAPPASIRMVWGRPCPGDLDNLNFLRPRGANDSRSTLTVRFERFSDEPCERATLDGLNRCLARPTHSRIRAGKFVRRAHKTGVAASGLRLGGAPLTLMPRAVDPATQRTTASTNAPIDVPAMFTHSPNLPCFFDVRRRQNQEPRWYCAARPAELSTIVGCSYLKKQLWRGTIRQRSRCRTRDGRTIFTRKSAMVQGPQPPRWRTPAAFAPQPEAAFGERPPKAGEAREACFCRQLTPGDAFLFQAPDLGHPYSRPRNYCGWLSKREEPP